MRLAAFRPEDLQSLALQADQQDLSVIIADPGYGPALLLAGPCYTVFDGDQVLGCGGVQEYGAHRAEVWGLLSEYAGPHMRWMTRAVAGWLQQAPYPRIEAVVSAGFAPGHRWVRLLGFEQEGPVRKRYMHDGSDAFTYVRFKR